MTIALITPPAVEPLSLTEIKTHLRIDHDHEDVLLQDTIKAAREYTEFACGQKMITQTWRQYEICMPQDRQVLLRVDPVQSVQAVTVFDDAGTPRILPVQDTTLIRGNSPAILEISSFVDATLAANGLEIDLMAGMGDLGVDVADTLKRAILLLVAHWYEFRGAVSPTQQPVSLPPGFDALMMPFRRAHL